MDLFGTLLVVALTLAGERGVNVPRDIRRGDERIRNRDEDLRTWIEDDDKELRQELIRISVTEARNTVGPDYSVTQYQQAKDQVLHRYRDQLRDAHRLARNVELSEQLPHRLVRRLFKRPVPSLAAPAEKAAILEQWKEPAEAAFEFTLKLREIAEQRRVDAGRPALRPLHLPS